MAHLKFNAVFSRHKFDDEEKARTRAYMFLYSHDFEDKNTVHGDYIARISVKSDPFRDEYGHLISSGFVLEFKGGSGTVEVVIPMHPEMALKLAKLIAREATAALECR